jgi:cell cycle sensor histidine kinase DivJ
MAGRPGTLLVGVKLVELFRSEERAGVEQALASGAGRASASFEGGRCVVLSVRGRADGSRAVLLVGEALEASTHEAAKLREDAAAARRNARETATLLADLSHEMRTPLNAVIGFADTIEKETFGPLAHPKYKEYAGHIRASGSHLLDLVSAILDLARIESDRFPLKRELVDAGEIARECAGIMRHSAEAAGLKLNVRIASDLPETLLDARALRQVLLNLLSNAVKFTSDGEITLDVKARSQDIVLTVSDTGVGMSEKELKLIGARFTAAQGAGVRGAKGAGLGLSLAFALAELMGGSLTLKSSPGEGMTASLRLPMKAAPRRLKAVDGQVELTNPYTDKIANPAPPAVITQLDRIEAYRRERARSAA